MPKNEIEIEYRIANPMSYRQDVKKMKLDSFENLKFMKWRCVQNVFHFFLMAKKIRESKIAADVWKLWRDNIAHGTLRRS